MISLDKAYNNVINSSVPFAPSTLSVTKLNRIELEDPHHRHRVFLAPVHLIWNKKYKDQIDFWSFLETKKNELEVEFPQLYDSNYFMPILDQVGREIYLATFNSLEDGQVSIATKNDGVLGDGKWLYVCLKDKFYVAKEKKYQFHHISLSGGEDVVAAGSFYIKQGRVHELSLSSGHYHPTPLNGAHCLKILHSKEINISSWMVSYRINSPSGIIQKKANVDEFLSSALQPDTSAELKASQFFLRVHGNNLKDIESNSVEMFMRKDGALFAGSRKIQMDSELCQKEGEFIAKASVILKNKQIDKIIFRTPLDNSLEEKKLLNFVNCLFENEFNLDNVGFRVLVNNATKIVSLEQVLKKEYAG